MEPLQSKNYSTKKQAFIWRRRQKNKLWLVEGGEEKQTQRKQKSLQREGVNITQLGLASLYTTQSYCLRFFIYRHPPGVQGRRQQKIYIS